MKAVFVV